jgi:hypothetical protein
MESRSARGARTAGSVRDQVLDDQHQSMFLNSCSSSPPDDTAQTCVIAYRGRTRVWSVQCVSAVWSLLQRMTIALNSHRRQ